MAAEESENLFREQPGRYDDWSESQDFPAAKKRKLRLQSEFYEAHTEHLLRMAGLEPGMRVLDVGCGAGDVSLIAARVVGPAGSVLGVDSDERIIDVARQRIAPDGAADVEFRTGRISDLELGRTVDALVGRLVLMHLGDPVAALRAMTRFVAPGGVITFQDFVGNFRAVPAVPLVEQSNDWVTRSVAARGGHPAIGEQLPAIFRSAQLPVSGVASAAPASTDPDAAAAYISSSVRNVVPFAVKYGIATAGEIDIDTLEQRMSSEIAAAGAAVFLSPLVGVWARRRH
ncbi:class I SAM-dependent methyltransferase [Actinoplanes sp. TBRC 11911]|uniref:class I SAM-dependent methyltransferase n=1 Tax=Actinoplanes sp. TBRC 11911 TaxID=2729386 RepID=UPI00145E3DA5|nr:class I SAM-dependent methyltransferase [Actinoplanes sp. TBRC 11911]NMO55332.1 class I SAM-dependent methyltransferase [Actinoplanes sp. TBRC 11911]